MPVIIYCIAISSNNIYSVRYPINLTDFPKLKKCSFWPLFFKAVVVIVSLNTILIKTIQTFEE